MSVIEAVTMAAGLAYLVLAGVAGAIGLAVASCPRPAAHALVAGGGQPALARRGAGGRRACPLAPAAAAARPRGASTASGCGRAHASCCCSAGAGDAAVRPACLAAGARDEPLAGAP